jgi:hypothetical protein
MSKEQEMYEQLKSLTPQERKQLKAISLGYTRGLPPTIDEFLDSPYYAGATLGKMMYPYWRKVFREIFPDEITTSSNMLALSLSLGAGKSTFCYALAAYNFCRLTFMENLDICGIYDLSKPIIFLFLHTDQSKAYQEFIEPLNNVVRQSPYLSNRNNFNWKYKWLFQADSLRSNKAVGENVIFATFSEVNFQNNEQKMNKRMNTIINRYTNRFMNFNGYLGGITLDSSPAGIDSLVEKFLRNSPFKVRVQRSAIWEVKGFIGGYSKETFLVYAGDYAHKPMIVDKMSDLPTAYDPDQLLKVPLNLRPNFESDIIGALQDLAGRSVSVTGAFIRNKSAVGLCFHLKFDYPQKIYMDLSDPADHKIQDFYSPYLDYVLPRDRRIAIHLDLGLKVDFAGLSAGYYAGPLIANEELNIKVPKICVPFTIRISRRKGNETAIDKIIEFLIWMSTRYEVYVTLDTYQSAAIYQAMVLNKIKCNYLSVDRTVDPYLFYKAEIYAGVFEGPYDEWLIKEVVHLKMIKGGKRIDHPSNLSKDAADSSCGVTWNIRSHLKWFATLPKNYQIAMAQQVMNELYGKGNKVNELQSKIMSMGNYTDEDEDD